MEKQESNLLDYSLVFFKWRGLFIKSFLIICIITAIISLIIPKWYRATAALLPPEGGSLDALNISSLVSNLPIGGLGLGLGATPASNYVAILKSRTVRQEIVERFNLQNIYDKEDIEKTLEELDNNIDIYIAEEGQIVIEVLDKVPVRSADMANTFVSLLDSINTHFKVAKARYHRILVEKRFTQNVSDLERSENSLKNFQETYGIVDIPEQTKAAILGAAELQTQIQLTEIELGVQQKFLRPDHASVVETQVKLVELRRKFDEIKHGATESPTNGDGQGTRLFIPFSDVPDLGMQYARLYREVFIQNKLHETLFQLYEQAKIQEASDTPTVQILDTARTPVRKTKPKRMIMVLVAGILSIIITALYILSVEYYNNIIARGDESAENLKWIKEQLSRDMRFWRKRPS